MNYKLNLLTFIGNSQIYDVVSSWCSMLYMAWNMIDSRFQPPGLICTWVKSRQTRTFCSLIKFPFVSTVCARSHVIHKYVSEVFYKTPAIGSLWHSFVSSFRSTNWYWHCFWSHNAIHSSGNPIGVQNL